MKGIARTTLKRERAHQAQVPMTTAVEELTGGATTTIKELWTAQTVVVELSRPLSPCEL